MALPLGLQWISVFVGELAAGKAWHACITSAGGRGLSAAAETGALLSTRRLLGY